MYVHCNEIVMILYIILLVVGERLCYNGSMKIDNLPIDESKVLACILLALIAEKRKRLDKWIVICFSIAILVSIVICLFVDQSATITPACAHSWGAYFPY